MARPYRNIMDNGLRSFVSNTWRDPVTECRIWLGGTGGKHREYGRFSPRAHEHWLAHRYAYVVCVGPIPQGWTVDHLCRNTYCVTPVHLEAVPLKVNILRGNGFSAMKARQTHCLRGHPFDARNTYMTPNNRRQCKACQTARTQKYLAKLGGYIAAC